MSKLNVNAVEPSTGTDITLGASGDTITVPSGASLTLTDSTLSLPTTINTDKIDPKSATALEIGSSGDTITVPVGAVTSLDGAVTINDSSNDVDFTIEGNGDADLFFVNGGTDRIGINAGATPEAKLHVIAAGGSEPAGYFECNSANAPMVDLNNSRADDGSEISLRFNRADTTQGAIGTTNEGLTFWTNSTLSEKMRIGSGTGSTGILFFNTTTQTGYGVVSLDFDGGNRNGFMQRDTDSAAGCVFQSFVYGTNTEIGKIARDGSNNTTNYVTTSDYRLKNNLEDLTGAIDRIKTLKPKRFNWISNPDGEKVDGFLAHEVTVKEAISGEKDAMHPEVLYTEEILYNSTDELPEGKNIGDVKHSIGDVKEETRINPQGIDQSKLVPLLTSALQEAITKIETLEAKVEALGA